MGREHIHGDYEFDEERNVWAHKSFDNPHIERGVRIQFSVQRLERANNGTLTILGSMAGPGCGPVPTSKPTTKPPVVKVGTPLVTSLVVGRPDRGNF